MRINKTFFQWALCSYLISVFASKPCQASDVRNTELSPSLPTTSSSLLRGGAPDYRLRPREKQRQQYRILQRDHSCLLVRIEMEFEHVSEASSAGGSIIDDAAADGQQEDEVVCELLDDADVEKAGGQYFVPIIGLDEGQLENIDSGETTLVADGAIFQDGAIQIPADAQVEFGTINDKRRKRRRLNGQTTGVKRVLAVRAVGNDVATSGTTAQTAKNIFGTGANDFTLSSQYRKCSHQKLNFLPYQGTTSTGALVSNGVVEVRVNVNVGGSDRTTVQTQVEQSVSNLVGDLRSQFDHVMLCLPPGTAGRSWIAYAYVNSWLSVYNDEWCQKLSTQVHEMGHNLGLAHSGKNGVGDYADKSGMMGFSYFEDDGPLQCFNPAKSYKLGWYGEGPKQTIEWNPLSQGTWFGNLVGVDDYGKIRNTNVVVKIFRDGVNDLYIGYNRKKGMNSGVKDHGDQVVVIEESAGYSVSNFLAGINPKSSNSAGVAKITNFMGRERNLVIDFLGYGDSSMDEAVVAIYFEDCPFPICCEGAMCETSPPTFPPVNAPPTEKPVAIPVTNEDINDKPINPVLFEISPNPVKQRAEYIELYNPTDGHIELTSYRICDKRNGYSRCDRLKSGFVLGPGEFFMLCRSKKWVEKRGMLPPGRTCHQDGTFNLNNNREIISLQRKAKGESLMYETVDKVTIDNSVKNQAYVRHRGHFEKGCGKECWRWAAPVTASNSDFYDEYEETDEAEIEIDMQSLPPSE